MKIYTTYGTYDYLNQIRLNHPKIICLFIQLMILQSLLKNPKINLYLNTLLLMKLLMKSMSLIINISIQLSSFQVQKIMSIN